MVKRKSRRRAGGTRAFVLAQKNSKGISALKKKLNKCCGGTDVKKEDDPYDTLDFDDFDDVGVHFKKSNPQERTSSPTSVRDFKPSAAALALRRGGHHLYKRLGVKKSASKKQMKKAYQKLKRKKKLTKKVKKAYKILSNKKSRKKYNSKYKKRKTRRKTRKKKTRKKKSGGYYPYLNAKVQVWPMHYEPTWQTNTSQIPTPFANNRYYRDDDTRLGREGRRESSSSKKESE
jgi:hypothetical protein